MIGASEIRAASSRTRDRVAAISSSTVSSRSPSSTVPSSMRRLGKGSNAAGIASPVCSASRPTSSRPAGSTQTADGSSGEPSKSTARGLRPSDTNTATVFDVP
ncbi:hypothetical protein [Asanoa hainanensis]|uniref:hypothetical protein n=1 Tax=Asanoa hainanensis TaxID=560556 RepID=UPI0015C646A1|nr:hypothetical protein [Asanoa hainanensis]